MTARAVVLDDFTVALLDSTPQEATYLYEGVVLDLPNTGTSRFMFCVGDSDVSRLSANFEGGASRLDVAFHNGTTTVTGYWNVTLALGDYIAIRIYQAASGAITAGLTINSAAEDTTLDSAIGTISLAPSWANARVRMAARSSALSFVANSGLISFKAQSGAEKTLAQMQALTNPDIAVYRSGQVSELATVSPSGATKGGALPGIDGKGGAWGVADASSVTASSAGVPLPYDSSLGSTIVKLLSGPAGSGTRRYLFGLPGEMNGFTAGELAGMVVGVYIPRSSELTADQVTLFAVDDQDSTEGDSAPVKGRWCWLWAARTWDAAATEAYFELRFGDGDTLVGANEVLYMALPTAVAGAVPLVPMPNAAEGSSSISAETLYSGCPIPPLASALYAKWKAWAPGGVLYIGAAGATGARLYIEQDSDGKVAVRYTDGTDSLEEIVNLVVAPGQEVRFLGVLTSTGTIRAYLRADGGDLRSTSASAELALPSDWGDLRVYMGSLGGGSQAAMELLVVKIIRGSGYSLDEAEAAA